MASNISLDDFPDVPQDEDSINSQELQQQIEQKLAEIQQPQQNQNINRNTNSNYKYQDYEQRDKIQYLQFQEQSMVKRLLEVRDEHKQIISELESLSTEVQQSVNRLFNKIVEQCNNTLTEQERDIKNAIQEIQQSLQFPSQYSMMSGSNRKIKPTDYQAISISLNQLNNTVKNWSVQSTYIPSQQTMNPLKLSFTQPIGSTMKYSRGPIQSSNKQDSGSKSPLRELNRFMQQNHPSDKKVQDLNSFIETLRLRIVQPKQQPKLKESLWQMTSARDRYQQNSLNTFQQRISMLTRSPQRSPARRNSPQVALTKQSYEYFKYRK